MFFSVVRRLETLCQTKCPIRFSLKKTKKKKTECVSFILDLSRMRTVTCGSIQRRIFIHEPTANYFFFSPNSLPRLKTIEACIYVTLDFIS